MADNAGMKSRTLTPPDRIQLARFANDIKIRDSVRNGFGHPYNGIILVYLFDVNSVGHPHSGRIQNTCS